MVMISLNSISPSSGFAFPNIFLGTHTFSMMSSRRSFLWTTISLITASLAIPAAEPVSSSAVIINGSSGFSSRADTTRRLVPRQSQSQSFYRRDLPGGTAFTPRNSIVVEYSHTSDDGGSPAAIVSFDASQTHPIVVVNTFDAYLRSVQCTSVTVAGETAKSSVINLQFSSKDIAAEAWDTWSPYQTFHLLTSHSGCNLEDELGAWRVQTIKPDTANQNIHILAVPIALHELGIYHVALSGHVMSGTWNPRAGVQTLQRRNTFTSGVDKDLSGTQILSGNASFDLPPEIQNKVDSANLNIQCVQCNINFNFTVDVNMTMSMLNVTALSVSTTVKNFDQSILLGVSTGANGLSLSYSRDILNVPLLGLEIRDLVNIGPEVGVSAELDLDMSGGVNFTMGAKASISPGAWATFDFLALAESDKGWDTAKFESIPLKLLSGNLNSTITTTVSPFIGIGITPPLNNGSPLIEARITQNSPSIVFSANMTKDVNRNCEPVGENDFESFSTAYQLSADMTFGTHVGLVGSIADVLPPWDEVFPHGDFQFLNQSGGSSGGSGSGGKACFVVVDDSATSTSTTKGAPAAILTAAPTGTLLGAASAVPSFDVSKIESYFSVNSQLPTNVNYAQMAQVTTVPDNIKNQVQKAAKTQTPKSGAGRVQFNVGSWVTSYIAVFGLYSILVL